MPNKVKIQRKENFKMKRIFLAVLILLLIPTSISFAHPPKETTAQFDLKTSILSVEVIYPVGGKNTRHYIEELTISLNGQKVISQKTKRQLNDTQNFLYFMPAVEVGDEIELVAVCNLGGQGIFKFNVQEEK